MILIDPFITKNPNTPESLKDLGALRNVDLILVTHGYGNHVGDTAKTAEMTGAKVALNADMGHSFAELGWVPYKRLIRFNKSGPTQPLGDGITVTMVHAEHSSELVYTDPQTKKKSVHPGGEPAGYIVELEDGSKIYHAGETGVFGDMAFIGSYHKPDIALLPIGGHFTMDPAQAAYAASKLLKGTPEQFKSALGDTAIEALQKACGAQKQGKTTILEVICIRELGDPFRRDALKKPVRLLDKYKDYTVV